MDQIAYNMTMNKQIRLLIFFQFFIFFSFAQNLVPNPSFEKKTRSPISITYLELTEVIDWEQPTLGSTDYFCKKCPFVIGVPLNCSGFQNAHSGNAYIGMVLFDTQKENYKEYFQCKLSQTLKKNKEYCVSFYVSLAESSKFATSNIGIVLNSSPIENKSHKLANTKGFKLLELTPQINNEKYKVIIDTAQWSLIQGIYKANGDENYIIIGSFGYDKMGKDVIPNPNYNFKLDQSMGKQAYYYFDDVSVVEINDENESPCKQIKIDTMFAVHQTDTIRNFPEPRIGESVTLKNLSFETNKSEILSSSFNELDKLVSYLQSHKTITIELTGHTDNIGKEEDNQKLSEARAKAVEDYLISKGIPKERISYKGFGSTKPITTNDTEEGRQQNRRVEFKISE